MKKILTLFAMLLVTVSTLLAQTSDQHPKLSYQMVVRYNCETAQPPVTLNGVTLKNNDLVFDQDVNGVAMIMVGEVPKAAVAFTAHTNYNGMMSLTFVDKNYDGQGAGIVKFTTLNSLRDVDWSKAKIVIQMDGAGNTTPLCINNVMEVLPVPYALSALNQDSLLSTLTITNYIDDAQVTDVKQIIASIWANQNNISKTFDSLVVFYIKNNPTAVKNLVLYFLGTIDSADVADAYKAFNDNTELSKAVIDTIVGYAKTHYDVAKDILLYYISTADMDDVKAVLTAIDNMNSEQVEDIVDTLLTVSAKYLSAHKDLVWKAAKKMMDEVITTNDLDMAYQYLKGEYNDRTTNVELFETIKYTIDTLIQKHLDDSTYLKKCVVCNEAGTQCDTIDICDLLSRVKNLENNPNFVKCPNLAKPTHVRVLNTTDSTYTITTKISNIPSVLDLAVGTDSIVFLVTYPNSLYKDVDTLRATIAKGANDTTMSAQYVHNDNNKPKGEIIVLQAMLKTKCTPLSAQFSEYDTIKLPMNCLNITKLAHTSEDYSQDLIKYNGIKVTGTLDRYYPEMIANDSIGFIVDYIDYDGTTLKHDTLFADNLPTKLIVKDNEFTATIDMTFCSKDVKVNGFVKCTDGTLVTTTNDQAMKFHVRGPELHILKPNADSTYYAFADSLVLSDTSHFHTSRYGDHEIEWYVNEFNDVAVSNGITNPSYYWKKSGANDTLAEGKTCKVAPTVTTNYVAWMDMNYIGKSCKVYDTIQIKYKPYECADSIVANGTTLLGPKVMITPDNNTDAHADTLCIGTKDTMTLSATSFVTVKATGVDSTLADMKANKAYNSLIDTFYYRWLEYGKEDLNNALSDGESYKITVNCDSSFVCALGVKFNNDTVCWKYDTIDVKYQFVCSTDSIKDIEGHKYATINVNNVCWTKSNMRSTKNSKADKDIALGATGSDSEIIPITNGSAKYFNPSASLHNFTDVQLGLLYNQAAADSVCPKGWHLPTDAEWTELENYVDTLGGTQKHTYGPIEITIANMTIISRKTTLAKYLTGGTWILEPVSAPANKVGFDAYPAGARHTNTLIPRQDLWPFALASFWTSTQYQNTDKYFSRSIYGNNINPNDYVLRDTANKILGFSVRCVYGEEEPVPDFCPTLGATTITWDVNNNIVVSTPINNYQEALVSNTNENKNKYIVSIVELDSYSYTATGEVANGLLTATISRSQIESLAQTLQVPQGSYNIKVVPQIALAGECASGGSVVGTATTQEIVFDAQYHIYPTVIIGTQTWMKENLRTTKSGFYTNPTDSQTPAIAYPAGIESNVTAYGLLYNYYAAFTEGLCPAGWRMPTNDDFETLKQNVNNCSGSNSGAKALADGTQWWNSSSDQCAPGNGYASNNSSGFSARPAGWWSGNGYDGFSQGAFFWADAQGQPYQFGLRHNNAVTEQHTCFDYDCLSVRCIKTQN